MNKIFSVFCFISFLCFSLYLTLQNYDARLYGWDMPGYLGAIYKTDNPDSIKTVHKLVYNSIKQESSKSAFEKTIGEKPFGAATNEFARSPAAFNEQIPYYQVKHSYNAFGYAIYRLGVSAPKALLIVNGFFYFFAGIFLFLIFEFILTKNILLSSILSLCVLLLQPIRQMASDATPDIVCLSLLLLFLYSVLKKFSVLFQFTILLNIVLVRPDMIILGISYFLLVFLYKYFKTKKFAFEATLYIFSLSFVYLIIVKFYNYPGWADVFYDSFINRRLYISKESPTFNATQYIDIVLSNLKNFKKISLLALLFSVVIIYFSKNAWEKYFTILIFLNIYLKFLFFPMAGEYRFFIGFILMLAIYLIYILNKRFDFVQVIYLRKSNFEKAGLN